MKEKDKGDTHVTFDDESAFFSHTPGLTLSHFVSSPANAYFQVDEFDVYSDTKEEDLHHHVAFLSSMCDDRYDRVGQHVRDYSFLRFAPCDSHDDTFSEYETHDFSVKSNMNDVYIDVAGMDHLQSANSVEPTPLWHRCHMTMEMILLIGPLTVATHIT